METLDEAPASTSISAGLDDRKLSLQAASSGVIFPELLKISTLSDRSRRFIP